MKIVVFGATGGTGQEIVSQALAQGHAVTAFARRPEAVKASGAGLTVIQGDVLDRDAARRAVAGQDVILCALGTRGGPSALVEGTRNILDAQREAGVGRGLWVSSFGVGDSIEQMGWLARNLVAGVFLKNALAEKAEQEKLIMASGTEWIIARPGGLTDGPRAGEYQCVPSDVKASFGRLQISRADVADFLLKNLTDPTYAGQAVGLLY